MLNHNIAAKGLIVNEKNEILCIRRRDDDVHNAGTWDFPGGRLEEGESPFDGLKRECIEEIGLEVNIKNPLTIHHFTRQDGQLITMVCFLCTLADEQNEITLSEEHTAYKWLEAKEAKEILGPFVQDVEAFETFFADNKNI